ncbi:hypothetical protein [Pseudoalteromonas sp. TB64]|uniref:hypothetical protein n=1 Tax=Pseudoalteromonas sp. TB64 TaxID=1938600 RepID=UPI00040EEAA3|nr:hypothetical protein [Pseudoalteromonas sp. TB64]
MSFWKKAGELAMKAGSAIADEAKEAGERNKEYKAEMPNKSDSDLARIVNNERSRSPLKASAAFKELKSRGFSPEDIKGM